MGQIEELEEDQDLCASCQKPAESKCTNCREVFYCARDCQKKHWKQHKFDCQGLLYKIGQSKVLGKFLEAAKDIKKGEIIFKDSPLVIGPVAVTPPVCLHCYKPVDGSFRSAVCLHYKSKQIVYICITSQMQEEWLATVRSKMRGSCQSQSRGCSSKPDRYHDRYGCIVVRRSYNLFFFRCQVWDWRLFWGTLLPLRMYWTIEDSADAKDFPEEIQKGWLLTQLKL